jgi:hypothetical protein
MRIEYNRFHWPPYATRAEEVGRYLDVETAVRGLPVPLADWRAFPCNDGTGYAYPVQWPPGRDYDRWTIIPVRIPETDAERVEVVLKHLLDFGTADGEACKMWVIDQAVRILAGEHYAQVIAAHTTMDAEWSTGCAP